MRSSKPPRLFHLPVLLAIVVQGCSPPPASSVPPATAIDNPAAAGSIAPHLATGADGRVVMSWMEPAEDGHALRYAEYSGGGWGEPRTVASGPGWFVNWADFPSVVPLGERLWAAHWLVRRPAGGYAYDVWLSMSPDDGLSWSRPAMAHTDGTDTEHGFVSLYPDGDGVGYLYLDGRNMENDVTDDPNVSGMTLRSANYQPTVGVSGEQLVDPLTCDCCQTDVALAANGPVAVYRNRTESEVRDIFVTRRVEGRWTEGVPLHDDRWEIPGCPVNGPVISARGDDVAVAWFTAAGDRPRVRLARSEDGGRSFAGPIEVATGDLLGHVGMAADAAGAAWITWLRRAGDGAELVVRRIGPGNAAGPERVLAEAVDVMPFSVPQAVLAGDRLLLAWTSGTYGHTRIGTAEMPLRD